MVQNQIFSVTECLISFDSFSDWAGKMPGCVGLTVGFCLMLQSQYSKKY